MKPGEAILKNPETQFLHINGQEVEVTFAEKKFLETKPKDIWDVQLAWLRFSRAHNLSEREKKTFKVAFIV